MRIIVRAVPSRQEYIDYLQKRLPAAEWIIDKEYNGAMSTYLQALELLNDKSGIIMEDDAVLCSDFTKRAEREVGFQIYL